MKNEKAVSRDSETAFIHPFFLKNTDERIIFKPEPQSNVARTTSKIVKIPQPLSCTFWIAK